MAQREFIAVQGQLVGSGPWELSCNSDRTRFTTATKAIEYGLAYYDHDDFWIATIEGNKLVDVRWMEEERERDTEEWQAVALAIGATTND